MELYERQIIQRCPFSIRLFMNSVNLQQVLISDLFWSVVNILSSHFAQNSNWISSGFFFVAVLSENRNLFSMSELMIYNFNILIIIMPQSLVQYIPPFFIWKERKANWACAKRISIESLSKIFLNNYIWEGKYVNSLIMSVIWLCCMQLLLTHRSLLQSELKVNEGQNEKGREILLVSNWWRCEGWRKMPFLGHAVTMEEQTVQLQWK